jgi:hypothetical protein
MDKIISIDVAEGEDAVGRVCEVLSEMCTPHGDIQSIDVFLNPTPDNATGLELVQMDEEQVAAAVTALRAFRFAGCAGFLFRVRRV